MLYFGLDSCGFGQEAVSGWNEHFGLIQDAKVKRADKLLTSWELHSSVKLFFKHTVTF